MKPTSKYFDSIRNIKSSAKKKAEPPKDMCQWKGCEEAGAHKAPMGRNWEGQYFNFCIKHVRQYNKEYNYFSGLDDEAIAKYQKDNITGQRPTWKVGSNASTVKMGEPIDPRKAGAERLYNRRNYAADVRAGRLSNNRTRKIKVLEKKAFDELNLKYTATSDDIKRRYKDLVKQNHPDANGGDRSSEARLSAIIKAYKQLQKAGYC